MRLAAPARLVLTASLFLAACSGGAPSSDDGSGAGQNVAPVISSPTTATVAENAAGSVYLVTATDANGDAIGYSITGGADAGQFQIDANGGVSFRTPPDFEAPTDANRDNVYEFVVTATDGLRSSSQTVRLTVTNNSTGNFAVRRVGTGFTAPVFVAAFPDGSGRMLVVERAGVIRLLNPGNGTIAATPFLDITGQVSTDGERGMLGLALAPDFMTSGNAYVFLTATDGSVQVRRFIAGGASRETVNPGAGDVLLSIPHPRNNHNGGWLGFGSDGLLYVATGDGGGANDPDFNGQNRSTLLGKILRIDVSRDDFPSDAERDYGIPASNPYVAGGGAGEVWLYGLRNPFRASFDRALGELWIGDVGQGRIEEIDRVQITQNGGLNMGWPLYEGSLPLLGTGPAGLTMPVAEYGHGSGPLEGNSITGGFVYRGPVEQLQGLYVFADFVSNNIWTVPIAGLTQGSTASSSTFTNRNAAFTPNAGTLSGIVGFGEDQAGNLYIVSINGSVFRIEAS